MCSKLLSNSRIKIWIHARFNFSFLQCLLAALSLFFTTVYSQLLFSPFFISFYRVFSVFFFSSFWRQWLFLSRKIIKWWNRINKNEWSFAMFNITDDFYFRICLVCNPLPEAGKSVFVFFFYFLHNELKIKHILYAIFFTSRRNKELLIFCLY